MKVEFHFIESGSHPEIVTIVFTLSRFKIRQVREATESYRLSDNNFSNLYVTRKSEMACLKG